MRRLPIKRNQKQEQIIEASRDFFGDTDKEEGRAVVNIALYLMGRKKGIILTEEDKEIKHLITTNLKDERYLSSLSTPQNFI